MTKQRIVTEPLFRSLAIAPEQCFEACKAQMDTMVELTSATLSAMERTAQAATRETQAQLHAVAEALGKAKDLPDIISMQGTLSMTCWEGTLRFWKSLAELAQQNQNELAQIMTRRCGQAGETWKIGAAAPGEGMAGTFAAGIQSAFEAARTANDAMLKAWTSACKSAIAEPHHPAGHAKAA